MQLKISIVKCLTMNQLRTFVQEFGHNVFFTDGLVLLCKICIVKVAVEKRFTVQNILLRNKHNTCKCSILLYNGKNSF